MGDSVKALGQRIKALRERRGLTQERLAEVSELSLKHLGEVERGNGNPTLVSLEKLAKGLGVTLHELFDLEHEVASHGELKVLIDQLVDQADHPTRQLMFRLLKVLTG